MIMLYGINGMDDLGLYMYNSSIYTVKHSDVLITFDHLNWYYKGGEILLTRTKVVHMNVSQGCY